MIHYGFQNLIVVIQLLQHLSAEGPAALSLSVVMYGPAFLATELLVRPAVSYPVPTLKTDRHVPYMTFIIHSSDY